MNFISITFIIVEGRREGKLVVHPSVLELELSMEPERVRVETVILQSNFFTFLMVNNALERKVIFVFTNVVFTNLKYSFQWSKRK